MGEVTGWFRRFYPRKFIASGGVIPFPWGISNRSWDRDGAWCWPVPLNLLVRYTSAFWYWLAIPRRPTGLENFKACQYVIAELKAEAAVLRGRNEYLEGSVAHQDGLIARHLLTIGRLQRELSVLKGEESP